MPAIAMKKCVQAGHYTMLEKCAIDGSETRTPHPPKFSIQDKYAQYRRTVKYGQ